MDPAIAALDFSKAGAILADMVESFLAAGAPPSLPEGADHDDVKDHRPTSVAHGVHLHSPVDAGASALQPGEHRAPVQSQEQGAVAGLEPGEDPHSRPRSRSFRDDQPRGLQDADERRGDGTSGSDLLARSLAPGALEQGLASPAGVLCHHRHAGYRRRWLLRPCRLQRRPGARLEGHVCASRAAHHSRAPPRRQAQQGAQRRAQVPAAGRLCV